MTSVKWNGLAFDADAAAAAIDHFATSYGQASTILAAHVALLDQFTAEIVGLIRQHFLPAEHQLKPYLDADLLFGTLSIHLGNGYFEMDKEVRRQLIVMLNVWGGHKQDTEYRSLRVARFVCDYAQSHYWQAKDKPVLQDYFNRIYWVALAYQNPNQAMHLLLQQSQAALAEDKHTDIPGVYFGGLAKLLALPLAAFERELTYARAVELLRYHPEEAAKKKALAMLKRIQDRNFSSADIVLPSPKDIIERYQQSHGLNANTLDENHFSSPPSNGIAGTNNLPNVGMFEHDQALLAAADVDSIFIDTDIHLVVVSGDLSQLKKLISNDRSQLNHAGKYKKTPLHLATKWAYTDIVRYLLDAGADIEALDLWERTPLHIAAINGQTALVELLLAYQADPNAVDYRKNTPLHLSIYYHHDEIVTRLLDDHRQSSQSIFNIEGMPPIAIAAYAANFTIFEKLVAGSPLHCISHGGSTLLQLAAEGGDYKTVEYLLSVGLDIDKKTTINTPLMIAAFYGYEDIVELLIDLGANVNEVDSRGWNPLHMACTSKTAGNVSRPYHHHKVVRLLIENGVNPDVKTIDDATVFHIAIYHEAESVIKTLIDLNADINGSDKQGLTPLLYAISIKSPLVSLLLDAPGININQRNSEGKSILDMAIKTEDFSLVKLLLEKTSIDRNSGSPPPLWQAANDGTSGIFSLLCFDPKVDIDDVYGGSTLLDREAGYGKHYFVRLLLDCGASVNGLKQTSDTPLIKALKSQKSAVVKMLLGAGANINVIDTETQYRPLALAVTAGDKSSVEHLLESGADIYQVDFLGNTLLHKAAENVELKLYKYLQEKGLDSGTFNHQGMGPFHIAIKSNNVELVQYLLDAKDELFSKQNAANGWGALHFATQRNHINIVDKLLAKGWDANTCSEPSLVTPLQLAAESNALGACERLIQAGADIDKSSRDKPSPLHLSLSNGHFDVAKLLIEAGADLSLLNSINGVSLEQVLRQRLERNDTPMDAEARVKRLILGEAEGADNSSETSLPQTNDTHSEKPQTKKTSSKAPMPLYRLKFQPLNHGFGQNEMLPSPWYLADQKQCALVLENIPQHINLHKSELDDLRISLCKLPFYDDVILVGIQSYQWRDSRRTLYFLYANNIFHHLDGGSPVIHRVNAAAPIIINTDNAIEYARFFGFFVHGDEGPFYILDTVKDNGLNPDLSTQEKGKISVVLTKPSFHGVNSAGNLLIKACIAYHMTIFTSTLVVHPNGMVEMLDDTPIVSVGKPIITVAIN